MNPGLLTTETMSGQDFSALIRKILMGNPHQLSRREYDYVAQLIAARGGCNLLIFGVGNDSELWLAANREGKTVFLEDSLEWIERVRERFPRIDIQAVNYGTTRDQWQELLAGDPAELRLPLPAPISGTAWDIVFVDGPTSFSDECPGRMKSLFAAAECSRRPGVDVVVHDVDRRLERAYCERFFSGAALVHEFERTRHYRT